MGLGVGFGMALGIANVLGYVFTLILTRALGPEHFGAFAAVNTLGLVLAIPIGTLQIIVGRRAPGHDVPGLRLGLTVGLVLLVLGLLVTPLATSAFHLDSWRTTALAMANLVPMAVVGAVSGQVLGRNRLLALAGVTVATAVLRVGAAVVVYAADLGVDGVFASLLVAGVLACGPALWLAREELGDLRRHLGRGVVVEVLRSSRTMSGLVLLSSADVLLARHYLPAEDAGGYALAALLGRIVFWGTQFVALTIVPALHPTTQRRRILEGAALVLSLGAAAAVVALVAPGLLIDLFGGSAYGDAAGLLFWFTVLGTLHGLAQVLLYAEMALGGGWLGGLTWVVTVAAVAVVVGLEHAHAFRILAVFLVASLVVVLVGLQRVAFGRRGDADGTLEPLDAIDAQPTAP